MFSMALFSTKKFSVKRTYARQCLLNVSVLFLHRNSSMFKDLAIAIGSWSGFTFSLADEHTHSMRLSIPTAPTVPVGLFYCMTRNEQYLLRKCYLLPPVDWETMSYQEVHSFKF